MTIAIIGAGAAGLMAAATIIEHDPTVKVVIIERNPELGKKVIISGGGRCNVTTGIRSMKTLFTKYPRGNKFLTSALYAFPPEAVYDWFESHGVPLKIEDDVRVFPISNDGHDVVGAFETLFAQSRVTIKRSHQVTEIQKWIPGSGESASPRMTQFQISFKTQQPLYADKVIITTGGQTYRHTGSQGDGYTFAESLGHTITPLAASLSSFITRAPWIASLAGVSWESAVLSNDRSVTTPINGPFMFTHMGITGPVVFAYSAILAYELITPQNPITITINLFPDFKPQEFADLLTETRTLNAKKSVINMISTLVPKSLATVITTITHIDSEKRSADLTKTELSLIQTMLCAFPLFIIGRGAGDEFVTAGGVRLSEVNPTTMESLITPNLYFAGEVLDIDGFTGGFNLQASWATGRLAGLSATENL